MGLTDAGSTSAVLPYSAVHDLVGSSVTARKIVRPAIRRDVAIVAQADRAQSFAARQRESKSQGLFRFTYQRRVVLAAPYTACE